MFEEEGPLGKGITVGKVQVALSCIDRTILTQLERAADNTGSEPEELSRLANEVCLNMLRQRDNWIAAASESKWFGQDDAGKAESLFNTMANTEASKFEKEYIPSADAHAEVGGPTNVVISLVLEIQGDETDFEGAGFSIENTNKVISSIAADVLVDDGYCLNACEVFWTPGDRKEVLTKQDMIVDFPTLVDL